MWPFHYLHVPSRPQANGEPKEKEDWECGRMQVVNSGYLGFVGDGGLGREEGRQMHGKRGGSIVQLPLLMLQFRHKVPSPPKNWVGGGGGEVVVACPTGVQLLRCRKELSLNKVSLDIFTGIINPFDFGLKNFKRLLFKRKATFSGCALFFRICLLRFSLD